MDWYVPITILPGVGMLILSTTSQMMTLSTEIGGLLSEKCSPFQHKISDLKIKQLGRLTRSAALLYISAACFVLSGILGAFTEATPLADLPKFVLIFGVFLLLTATGLLVHYGFNTIKIRKLQHQHNHELE